MTNDKQDMLDSKRKTALAAGGQEKIDKKDRGVRSLYPQQCSAHSQLRRTLSVRRDHLHRLRRIHHQPGREQADGQKTTDALESEGRPPVAAGPYTGSKRGAAGRVQKMVPKL